MGDHGTPLESVDELLTERGGLLSRAIKRYGYRQDWILATPQDLYQDLAVFFLRNRERLEAKPHLLNVASVVNIAHCEIKQRLNQLQNTLKRGKGHARHDLLDSQAQYTPDDSEGDAREVVEHLLRHLAPDDAELVRLCFGLNRPKTRIRDAGRQLFGQSYYPTWKRLQRVLGELRQKLSAMLGDDA